LVLQRKTLNELLSTNESAWPMVQSWINQASSLVEVLPYDEVRRTQALVETQVTVGSPMGAVIYETGGILVDHGWLRILGSGHPTLPRSMPDWNRGRVPEVHDQPGCWFIADDVVGGFFALNGGALGEGPGDVYYYAPDSLRWEHLAGIGYSKFLVWSMSSHLREFYAGMYWPGWESEVSTINGDQALSIYPFPSTREGKDVSQCSRRPVAVSEIFELNLGHFPIKLGDRSKS
jgi:Protein of unknown function DUF2625